MRDFWAQYYSSLLYSRAKSSGGLITFESPIAISSLAFLSWLLRRERRALEFVWFCLFQCTSIYQPFLSKLKKEPRIGCQASIKSFSNVIVTISAVIPCYNRAFEAHVAKEEIIYEVTKEVSLRAKTGINCPFLITLKHRVKITCNEQVVKSFTIIQEKTKLRRHNREIASNIHQNKMPFHIDIVLLKNSMDKKVWKLKNRNSTIISSS